jgi:phthalate 4,5-cis-dihydrodiol dehydrogenase
MSESKLRVGVAGLGRAFTLMLPTFLKDPRIQLVSATDPQPLACAQFERDFGAPCVGSVEDLCARSDVQVIYIATPHQLHASHVELAAAKGKHILVEKPMALSLDDCDRMIQAVKRAGTVMVVGHSHSFNAPILRAYDRIRSGEFGSVRMIHSLNYTDFLYRPRRPEELDTEQGGGVIFSQAAHQLDIVRLLGGGLVTSVTARTGAWDPQRPTEGAYSALLSFANGAFASLSYSGYAHFDSDTWMEKVGELGQVKNDADYGSAKRRLATLQTHEQETALKAARNYGAPDWKSNLDSKLPSKHQHFGPLIISCDKADLRPVPNGLWIDGEGESRLFEIPDPIVPRQEVIDELYNAVLFHKPVLHSGTWARATTELSLAILESARGDKTVLPKYQIEPIHSI